MGEVVCDSWDPHRLTDTAVLRDAYSKLTDFTVLMSP